MKGNMNYSEVLLKRILYKYVIIWAPWAAAQLSSAYIAIDCRHSYSNYTVRWFSFICASSACRAAASKSSLIWWCPTEIIRVLCALAFCPFRPLIMPYITNKQIFISTMLLSVCVCVCVCLMPLTYKQSEELPSSSVHGRVLLFCTRSH